MSWVPKVRPGHRVFIPAMRVDCDLLYPTRSTIAVILERLIRESECFNYQDDPVFITPKVSVVIMSTNGGNDKTIYSGSDLYSL